MKIVRCILLLGGLLIFGVAQSQQNPVTISGVVLEAATGKPMPRASLMLKPFSPPPQPGTAPQPQLPPSAPVTEPRYPGLTNDSGEFVLRNIPPGRYELIASRNGYVHAEYGQRGPNGRKLPLDVVAGRPVAGIQLAMTRAAAISGRVVDSKGEPYPYVQMNLRRVSYAQGVRTLTIVGSTYTDDLGEYRIYGLPPGQYVLSTEGETSGQGILPVAASLAPPLPGAVVIQGIGGSMLYSPDPANERRPAQRVAGNGGPVYFRNAINDRDATPIELRPGDDFTGTDIAYSSTPKVPVILSWQGGTGVVQVTVASGLQTFRTGSPSGTVRALLSPGSYVAAGTGTESANRPLAGYVVFDVTASGAPTVALPLNTPVAISGRIALEGSSQGTTNQDLGQVRVRLRRTPVIVGLPEARVTVSATGEFTTQAPVAGDYTMEVISLPDGLRDRYLKSGNTLRIAGQAVSDVSVVLGLGGQIDGNARGENGQVVSNVTVVLVPEQRARTDRYKSVTSDTSGGFRFEGIGPGRYLLLSWEDVEADAWFNPEFIRAVEDRGKPVAIVEGSRDTVDAAVIPVH